MSDDTSTSADTTEGRGIDISKRRQATANRRNYEGPATERLTFRAPGPLLDELNVLVEAGIYRSQAAAMRDALRHLVLGDYCLRPQYLEEDENE